MKTLYIECNMGAAGDMLMASLLELTDNPDVFLEEINSLGLDGVQVTREKSIKCGITGTHVNVLIHGVEEISQDIGLHSHEHGHHHDSEHSHDHEHHHDSEHNHEYEHHHNTEHSHSHDHMHYHNLAHSHSHDPESSHTSNHSDYAHDSIPHIHTHTHAGDHHHSGLQDIINIIDRLSVPEKVKNDAIAIYRLIAEAESHAHDRPVSEVHFHEVGAMDAIADIVGVCLLINKIAPEQIIVSPINTGSGFVRCAHGILPVPAPATAHILKGVPFYSGKIKGELCTPTGAAILKHFADSFSQMPELLVQNIGYGMGKKDFEAANCVRTFIGEVKPSSDTTNNTVAELMCNLDDMTGEAIGYAMNLLMEHGALDAFTIPIQMKKSRPGVLLVCICKTAEADSMASLILKHTTTIGVRKNSCSRYTLDREITTISTEYGELKLKKSSGYGITKSKIEYEDAAEAALKNNVAIQDIYDSIFKLK